MPFQYPKLIEIEYWKVTVPSDTCTVIMEASVS